MELGNHLQLQGVLNVLSDGDRMNEIRTDLLDWRSEIGFVDLVNNDTTFAR